MMSSEMGAATAASARYGVSGPGAGASARRDPVSASASDPFDALVDRYAEDDGDRQRQLSSSQRPKDKPAGRDVRESRESESRRLESSRKDDRAAAGRGAAAHRRDVADGDRRRSGEADRDEDRQDGGPAGLVAQVQAQPARERRQQLADAGADMSSGIDALMLTGENGSATRADGDGDAVRGSVLAEAGVNVAAGAEGPADGLLAAIRAAQSARSTDEPNAVGAAASSVAQSLGLIDGAEIAPDASESDRAKESAAARRTAINAIREALGRDGAAASASGADSAVAASSFAAQDSARAAAVAAKVSGQTMVVAVRGDHGSAAVSSVSSGVSVASGDSAATVSGDVIASNPADFGAVGAASAFGESSASGQDANGSAAMHARNVAKQTMPGVQSPGLGTLETPTHLAAAAASRKSPPSTDMEPPVPQQRSARAAQAIAAFQAASVIGTNATPAAVRAQVVGGASAASNLLDSELPTQIIHGIRVQFDNGSGEARVRLNPGFLGALTVGVRMDGGTVVASLQASDPQVREWMRTNEPMLRQALADQGLNLERLVIVDEESQGGAGDEDRGAQRDRQEQEAPRRPRRSADESTFELVL